MERMRKPLLTPNWECVALLITWASIWVFGAILRIHIERPAELAISSLFICIAVIIAYKVFDKR